MKDKVNHITILPLELPRVIHKGSLDLRNVNEIKCTFGVFAIGKAAMLCLYLLCFLLCTAQKPKVLRQHHSGSLIRFSGKLLKSKQQLDLKPNQTSNDFRGWKNMIFFLRERECTWDCD